MSTDLLYTYNTFTVPHSANVIIIPSVQTVKIVFHWVIKKY